MTGLVLITRAEEDAADLRPRLEARGYTPIIAPLFRVAAREVAVPPNVQAVLVTSRNAVRALQPSGKPVLAVGDATAARAVAQGFTDVVSASGDAVALAALADRRLDPRDGPLLLATGAGQGWALAADLRKRGFRVRRRVCYAVRAVARFPDAADAAIRSGRLHAVLFLSAETASCFVRLLPPGYDAMLKSVKALAIGAGAVQALGVLPWLHVCRAETPTLDGVLAKL